MLLKGSRIKFHRMTVKEPVPALAAQGAVPQLGSWNPIDAAAGGAYYMGSIHHVFLSVIQEPE